MTRWNLPFVSPSNRESDSYYEIIGDWELIEASFAQQYGIRLRNEDNMSWDEFATLLSGLNGETPLGHIVSIRSETDKEKLKRFTPEERKIRNTWRAKHKNIVTNKAEYDQAMAGFHAMFKSMAEKGG